MKWFMVLLAPVAAVVLLCATPSTSGALPPVHHIEKDIALYGNLDQDDVGPGGNVMCGPTAAINSFVYLENKYSDVYDRHLVPDTEIPPDGVRDYDELVNAALTLAAANYMNTTPPGGTWDDMFIYGKYQYIEERAPHVTTYAAQMLGMWAWPGPPENPRPPNQIPPIPKPIWVADNMYPTWQFIFQELAHCEDVEILINWDGGGHFLTLTGFDFTDTDGDGVMDPGEEAVMKYIDPSGGVPGEAGIWNVAVGSDYEIMTDYETGAIITMAVTESIPEPATIALIACSLMGFVGVVRKRLR